MSTKILNADTECRFDQVYAPLFQAQLLGRASQSSRRRNPWLHARTSMQVLSN